MLKFLLSALLIFLAAFSAVKAEEPLIVMFNTRPPYMSPDGSGGVTGLTAGVAAYALKKAGIACYWKEVPSQRQLYMIQHEGGRLAAVGWFKNPEREAFAKYSHVLYTDKTLVLLSRADNSRVTQHHTLQTLLSDRSLLILTKAGYSYGPYADAVINRLHRRKHLSTAENIEMIRMIWMGHSDCMLIAPEEAGPAIAAAGLPEGDFRKNALIDMPPGEHRYLIYSRQVDDETIRRIDLYIDEYHRLHAK